MLLFSHWGSLIFHEVVGLLPCKEFSESWSWRLSVFQTVIFFFRTASFLMPFTSIISMCGFYQRRVSVLTVRTGGLHLGQCHREPLRRLFLCRWGERKLWPVSSTRWSEDPSRVYILVPCSHLHDFSCKSIYTCFQKRRSQVFSAGELHIRLCQKLPLGRRRQKQPFSSFFCFQRKEGQLIFFALDIQTASMTTRSKRLHFNSGR